MEPTANKMLSDVVPSNGMDAQSAIDKVISQRQTQNVGQTETGLDEAQSAINTVIQQRKSPKSQLNSTFASVSGINPDDAAKAQQIGGAIGLGQDLTMRNSAEVKRIADQKRFEMYDLMESDPILGRQMMRREFASVAHDDIPQLTSVGALFKVAYSAATLSPFPKDVALEISQQYEGTQYQTEEALIYHWMNNNNLEEKDLSEETRQRLKFLEQNAPPPINTYLFGGLSYTAGQARSMAPEVAKYAIAGGVTMGALGLAGGPLAPATVAGGVLTGIGLGATAGVGVITSRIEGGMIYKDLLRSGVPKDVARTLASIGGTANGLIEIGTLGLATAPFKPLLRKVIGEQIIKRGIEIAKPTAVGAVKTAAKYYAMAEGGEQIQELSQEVVSDIVEEIARSYAPGEYESRLATPEGRLELINKYFNIIEQTFKATAIIGSFGPMLNLAVDAKNIRDSAKTKQFLTDLSKNVQATKLKGRSPSALANFVAAQAKGTAAETMYVDAEEMSNVLNQSGLTAQQIDNALPGVREQLAQATSGGDIQIPTAQFAANIVGTKLEAPLMEHARLAPDAISAKQAIAQQESMQQNMKDAQVEMAVQEVTNAQFVREAKEIEKVVNDQLIAAGRPPTEAAFAAKLVQARAVTGAAAAGITPAQWVAQHPVPTIQSQQQAAQQALAQGSFEQASRADLGLGKPVGKQVVNIETNEFKDWFAGSVATVTKDGYPIKLYRWARSPFVSPELDSVAGLAGQGSLLYGDGVTLTTEPMAALEFKGNPQDGSLLEVVTRIKNPLVIDAKGDSGFGIDAFNKTVAKLANISVEKLEVMAEKSLDKYNKFVTKTIRKAGYDGVHVKDAMQSDSGVMVDNWVLFNTEDIMTTNVATAQDAWNFEDAAPDQQEGFNESNYRPKVVRWAKEKFGDRTAPDGSSVWQNFTEWFGDSKVVDAEGKPMVVYHGTESKFNTFEIGRGDMIFVSTDADAASTFGTLIISAYIKSLKPFNGEKNLGNIKDFIKKNYSQIKKEIRIETKNRENDDELNVHSQNELLSRIQGLDYYVFESSATLRYGIKKLGFDSIQSDENGFVAMGIFEPTQIKSAIANVGTFGQQDPNILRQEAVPAAFYSALEVEVGKSTTKSASADSWKQQIKGLIAKGVVKEKEVYWSGLNNWLDLQEGKITKEQVQAFLDAGGVKIKVERSKDEQSASELTARQAIANAKEGLGGLLDLELENTFNEYEELVINNLQNQETAKDRARRVELEEFIDEALDAVDMRMAWEFEAAEEQESASFANVFEPKYAGYQLPGGTNYRELVVMIPSITTIKNLIIRKIGNGKMSWKVFVEGEKDFATSFNTEEEAQLHIASYGIFTQTEKTKYESSHWPGIENPIVHVRLNDRVDADGKWVLFVEEVQSDWGQAGREKGFVGETQIEIEKLEKQKAQAESDAEPYTSQGKDAPTEIADRWNFAANRLQTLRSQEVSSVPTAPFVESTSGWLELGLKQILLEAVNGKYDRVAFVDGDQSVQRYRKALTKAVDEVEITRNDDGTYTYSAIKNGAPVQGEQSVSANRINEVFGKAGSKQLLEEADANPDEIHTIASGDIEIGGEGMRKFYDTIVPQALSKMLKKLGGDKIGEVNIGKFVGRKINAKTFADEAVKLINGDIERLEFEDNLGLDEGDIPESWIGELTDLPPRFPKAEARKIAIKFAAKVKDKLAGSKSITQQGFTVTPALTEQVSQGLPLFQAAEGGARGAYDPIKNLIGIGKNADYSTVAHELAHWYVVDLFRTASDSTASEASRADADILLKWFGIAGDNVDQRLANWNAMTLDEQRRHHEAVAYNWELYLHTGKAPSVELQGVFDRFRRWLTRAYKSIRDDLNEIYKQQFGTDLPFLTNEVRGVFDRMLASEEQIARREAIDNFKGMYQTQEESGMNDATWAAYQAEIAEAHEIAVTDLTKATVKQMEWLSGARKGILKAMQAAHNALRRSVQGEESDKMNNEPVRKAERFFKTGKMVDPSGKEIEVLVGNKIDSVAVGGMYPTSTTGLAPAVDLTKLRGMTMEGGLAPDLAAEMFGFSSGDELIRALAELKPFKDELKERTDARMLDEHGGMNTEAEKEEAINKALANEVRARMVAIENRYLTKVKTPVAVIMQGAKELARTILGRMAIKDIKPRNYVAAEARVARDKHTAVKAMQSPETAGKSAYTRSFNEQIAAGVEESVAASEALVKSVEAIKRAQAKIDAHKKQYGDVDPAIVAAKASHQQVIQGQLAKEGYKILEEVEKQVSLFKRFFKDDKKIAATRNMDLVNAARSILAFYGLGKHDKLPGAYLKQIEQYNPGLFETISAMVNEAKVGTPDYKSLTFEEFQSMQETVDALWQLAKRENQIKIEGKMVSLGQVTEKLEKRMDVVGVPTTIAGETQAVTSKDRAVRHIYSMKAILRRVEHWADSIDGAGNVGGPFTKYIWRPISQALDAYRIDRNKYVKRYVELLKQVPLPAGKIAAPELNYTFGAGNGGIGIAELLGAIMHSGNISNLEKLLIGRKWATVSEDGTMDTSRWDAFIARVSNDGTLTKEHFDFIQAVWDLNEELKPMVQKAHYDIEGYYFKEVEATPFTNRFGAYRGGYVPAKTDPFIVRDAQRQLKMSELESDFRAAMPSTGAGFTKSRVKYNKALSLDIRLMAKHIDDVIRYSHVQPAVKDILRILKKSSFADKLTQMDAMAIDEMLTPWLNRAARQITSESGRWKPIDTFWRTVRSRTGISVMIGNITNALQQVTGLFMSALKVKPAILGNALYAYFSSPRQSAQEIAALSLFMSNRMENQIFDLQDQMNQLILNPNKFQKIQKWSSHHGYFLQSAFQNMVDIVTWTGAYNQHLAESGVKVSDADAQKEAVNRADAAVRLTQGTMNPEGLAAFEVGTPFYKTFIQFTGYFNMLANLNTDEYVKIFRDLGWRGNEGKLAYTFLMGFAAQAIISDAIVKTMRGGWEDDDDDGYLDVFMDWIFGSMGRSAVAMVPFGSTAMTAVSQIVMPTIKGKAGTGYDDRIQSSPSISALTSSTIGVGRAILDVVSEDKEVTGQDVKDVMTLISLTTGVPVTLLGRPVSYLVDINRGKVEPTSTADLMRGLITGTATKESKKR